MGVPAVIGGQRLDGLCQFGLSVLDDVSLVEDAVVPPDGGEEVNVIAHQIVGGNDEVVVVLHLVALPAPLRARLQRLLDLVLQLGPLKGRSGVVDGVEVLGADKLAHLVQPVPGEGGRTDDDGGQGPVLRLAALVASHNVVVVRGEYADRLEGLPQAHLVGDDAVQFVLVEKGQPVEAVLLVDRLDGALALQLALRRVEQIKRLREDDIHRLTLQNGGEHAEAPGGHVANGDEGRLQTGAEKVHRGEQLQLHRLLQIRAHHLEDLQALN
ncbi:hypothetical protein TYRP_014255 [Tyrophagus putrescentiae]|nr:hypothetical protein TYRP_014255 [Tyrophagus putrescentiae]